MVIGPTQSAIPRRRFDSKAGQTLITDVTINRARAFPIRRLHKKKATRRVAIYLVEAATITLFYKSIS
jgi:hypothetical protein